MMIDDGSCSSRRKESDSGFRSVVHNSQNNSNTLRHHVSAAQFSRRPLRTTCTGTHQTARSRHLQFEIFSSKYCRPSYAWTTTGLDFPWRTFDQRYCSLVVGACAVRYSSTRSNRTLRRIHCTTRKSCPQIL